jgi:hypothetical protein
LVALMEVLNSVLVVRVEISANPLSAQYAPVGPPTSKVSL